MQRRRAPEYRLHAPTGFAVVSIRGEDRFLGEWRSRESLERYHELLLEWSGVASGPTIFELSTRFREHAAIYYRRPDGTETTELRDIPLSLREILTLYGTTRAGEFTLAKLKLVRHAMIERGLSRRVINQRIGRVKRMFRWAAGEELIPAAVPVKLSALADLRLGRSRAKEHPPRGPAIRSDVESVLPYVSPVVGTMIAVLAFSGMRPGELVAMRRGEIDTSASPWRYAPATHKTAWRGVEKGIFLGPEAQRLLRPYLDRPAEAFVFSAAESRAWWDAHATDSPFTPESVPVRSGPRTPRARFSVKSFTRAISRACSRAGVPRWSANQLRKWAATRVEEADGLEAACAMLGHALVETTQIYARGKATLARRVAERRG